MSTRSSTAEQGVKGGVGEKGRGGEGRNGEGGSGDKGE